MAARTLLRSYKVYPDDDARIRRLAVNLRLSQGEVVRRAVREFEASCKTDGTPPVHPEQQVSDWGMCTGCDNPSCDCQW